MQRLKKISQSIQSTSGMEAANFNLAQQYIKSFQGLSTTNKNIYLNLNLLNIEEVMQKSLNLLNQQSTKTPSPKSQPEPDPQNNPA